MVTIHELVAVAKAAAAEAADNQERFAAEDTEARKIVDIMERFLRKKARVIYGGAAINAHLPADKKFYDPSLYLPDYDFLTPDPLQDCADLIVTFHEEGFTDVEAKFGIHDGTYKVFVNFRSAADITYMPLDLYRHIKRDSTVIDGIHYASVNYLRMNMYLELSRPAGMVSRWEKVYERLLLLNEAHPLRAGHCPSEPLKGLASVAPIVDRIIHFGIDAGAVFLSGAQADIVLMISDRSEDLVNKIATILHLKPKRYEALGELLPARVELYQGSTLRAVVFETLACHSYTTVTEPAGYRMGSTDLLIQMYYAMYFAELSEYLPVRLLCVIQELIHIEMKRRTAAARGKAEPHDVFPLDCVGHQPTVPELKKQYRTRVAEKKKDLNKALFRVSRRKRVLRSSV
jgi:hypothetical protein